MVDRSLFEDGFYVGKNESEGKMFEIWISWRLDCYYS